jgi:hypothetical protein
MLAYVTVKMHPWTNNLCTTFQHLNSSSKIWGRLFCRSACEYGHAVVMGSEVWPYLCYAAFGDPSRSMKRITRHVKRYWH